MNQFICGKLHITGDRMKTHHDICSNSMGVPIKNLVWFYNLKHHPEIGSEIKCYILRH